VAAAARQDRAQWAYTPRNLLDRYTPPLLGSTSTPTTYTADKDRNTTSIVQPGGITVDFTYDADGKLVRMSQPRGTTARCRRRRPSPARSTARSARRMTPTSG